ncbi:TFC4 [Candida theae]|uniref:TFC4 n=1 Tax=Candida theae TaxID=1198502 RepID=A0AAD5BEQ4_9ASCO|nr:TFC4 [Candida theae]KAI5958309.1 TFC4 [Candida theae]
MSQQRQQRQLPRNQIFDDHVEEPQEVDHRLQLSDSDDDDKIDQALTQLDMSDFDMEAGGLDDGDDYDGGEPLFIPSDEEEDEDFKDISDDDEDDYDDEYNFKDALKGASNFKVRNRREKLSKHNKSYYRKRMMRADNRELDPEVRMNLSLANEAFVRNDLQSAQQLYVDVIKRDPKNFSAYKAIGEIYKSQGKLDECCSSWLLAANLHPWDSDFWGQVAELSNELGHIDQAIYCYTRAITSDTRRSANFILERALLYKEKRQFGKALDGLQKIRQLYPQDANIVKYLAGVYSEQKRLNDAINLYMRILDQNINTQGDSEEQYPKFDWPELNILLELHVQHRSLKLGINVLKLAARWIQGRMDETWWDENDDSEFDSKRRFKKLSQLKSSRDLADFKTKPYELPIDIRFKLGILRLGSDQKDEAMHHFEYLLDDDQAEIADLNFEAGKQLQEYGYYEEALTFLTRAFGNEELVSSFDLVTLLGKCYFEIADYAEAKEAYEELLSHSPNNVDFKLALAETLYHLGDDARAEALINEVQKRNRKSWQREKAVDEVGEAEGFSLIRNKIRKTPKRTKLSEQEKEEIEANAKRKVLEKYGRMERLQESMNSGDRIAIAAWIQLASQLIEMFTSIKSFFPKDRSRRFKGIIRYRTRKDIDLDEKLARAYNLLEGFNLEETFTRQTLVSKTEFRGLTYDQWFDIFAQFGLVMSKYENNTEYADDIINVALSVNIFVHDKSKDAMLRLLKLMFGIKQEQAATTVFHNIRTFLLQNQFSPYMCRLFFCCYASGAIFAETFSCYNHQKFFLRQIKAYDSCFKQEHVSGMPNITAEVRDIELGRSHPDLTYIYANLLGGKGSHSSLVFYLNRAYKYFSKDPMICLVLGLAHVHRSMQRLSSNRHIQLLQGISILLEYKTNRLCSTPTIYEIQEVEYNFGRLFHMLGLTSLAVGHYNSVLRISDNNENIDDDYDLKWEAAYNLSLIYSINGNSQMSRHLTEKYLAM